MRNLPPGQPISPSTKEGQRIWTSKVLEDVMKSDFFYCRRWILQRRQIVEKVCLELPFEPNALWADSRYLHSPQYIEAHSPGATSYWT